MESQKNNPIKQREEMEQRTSRVENGKTVDLHATLSTITLNAV
jgi:hypothetical protein